MNVKRLGWFITNLEKLLRKKGIIIFGILILFLFGVLLFIYVVRLPSPLCLHKVKFSAIEDIVSMNGMIHSKREILVMPPYDGYVEEIYVKQGDIVAKNTPLVKIARNLLLTEQVHPLRAPYAGVITIINRANGQFVQQAGSRGTDFVLKIEDLSELFIQADANDVDVVKLHTGQLASIKISAVPNKIFSGVVAEVALSSKTEQTQWGNQKIVYPLKVLFTDQDNALRPGMNALVDVTTAKKDQVIVIPIEFLHQAGEETYVLLKNHIKRVVTIGLLTPLFVEIVNGLTVGEEIERVNYFVD